MRHLFSITFLTIYGAAAIQLSFLAFSDTLDDGALTYIAVGLGVIAAPIIRGYQKWKLDQSANVLIEYGRNESPFHLKILNLPLIVFFTTFFSIGVMAVVNHKLATDVLTTKQFTVKAIGQKRVKYDSFDYVHISDGITETSYNLGKDSSNPFQVGDKLTVTLREGFWSFYIVENIKKSGKVTVP